MEGVPRSPCGRSASSGSSSGPRRRCRTWSGLHCRLSWPPEAHRRDTDFTGRRCSFRPPPMLAIRAVGPRAGPSNGRRGRRSHLPRPGVRGRRGLAPAVPPRVPGSDPPSLTSIGPGWSPPPPSSRPLRGPPRGEPGMATTAVRNLRLQRPVATAGPASPLVPPPRNCGAWAAHLDRCRLSQVWASALGERPSPPPAPDMVHPTVVRRVIKNIQMPGAVTGYPTVSWKHGTSDLALLGSRFRRRDRVGP